MRALGIASTVLAFVVGYALVPVCTVAPSCPMACCHGDGANPVTPCDGAACCDADVLPGEITVLATSLDTLWALHEDPPRTVVASSPRVDLPRLAPTRSSGSRLHVIIEVFLI